MGLLLAAGCVTGSGGWRPSTPSKPIVEFPTSEALVALAGKPAVLPTVSSGDLPAEGWQLASTDTAAGPDEPWQPQGPWESAVAEDALRDRAQLRLTHALSCVAHEIGRYVLANATHPPATLEQFLVAACGAVVPRVDSAWISGEIPAGTTDKDILSHWRGQVKGELLARIPASAAEAGFWFGRTGTRAVAMMTFATPMARFTTLSLVPDAQGDAVIEGELLGAADVITGYANQGTYGVEACPMDPGIARPRFRAVCHMAPSDETTWVQLLYAAPKRVLATPFVQILLRRPDRTLVFPAAPATEARPVPNGDAFAAALLEQLNRVRVQAGFRPLTLSKTESVSAMRLAGHYFAAALTPGQDQASDRIALGLLAGWDTTGMIRDGQFMSTVVGRTRDAGRWLAAALATPLGRSTLLSPDIEEIAVGAALLPQPEGLAAVVTGYRFYHGADHTNDVHRLYGRLMSARKRLGLRPPLRLAGMADRMREELARVQAGQLNATDALQSSLAAGVDRFGAGMRGYVIETTSLDALEIPEDVLRRPDLYLEIAVTHHKPAGAAWAQLVILVVFADPAGATGQSI